VRRSLLAVAFVLAGGLAAGAQELVKAEPDAILNIARGYGSASLDQSDEGAPLVSGRANGRPYLIFFDNCPTGTGCLDIRFFAVFPGNKASLEVLNNWNREKRWGKAYSDGDLDAALELDVNMSSGMPYDTVDQTVGLWVDTLGSFAEHIGAN
jgi:hypothetical protein